MPELLPTPTLAMPVAVGDPLRPPTPEVLPSPTPSAGAAADGDIPATEQAIESRQVDLGQADLPEDAGAAELLALGEQAMAVGDFQTAAAAFASAADLPAELTDQELARARVHYAVALFQDSQTGAAVAALEEALVGGLPDAEWAASPVPTAAPLSLVDVARFYLARGYESLGRATETADTYEQFLTGRPELAAYVQPVIATARLVQGDVDGAIAALSASVNAPAQRLKLVDNRRRLAEVYLNQGNYAGAIEQYDAIYDMAQTEITRGQMTYLAGRAELLAGNTEAGYERFLYGVANYPRAVESYQGLIELVNTGYPVDEYQRGVVDYYAGVYQPAVEAFQRHLEALGESPADDTHLFLAWTYEALGDPEAALASLDAFAERGAATALFERAAMLARLGSSAEAIEVYDAFLAENPDDERAVEAAWAAAGLADVNGDDSSGDRYVAVADTFPFFDQTPLALRRSAVLAEAAGDSEGAVALWQRLAEQYPANEYGAEAAVRLLLLAGNDDESALKVDDPARLVTALTPTNYYALRARDLVAGEAPFLADSTFRLPTDWDEGRQAAESWLIEQLDGQGVTVADLATVVPEVRADARLQTGALLWQLGLYEEGKAELEDLRQAFAADPVATYQLALVFRDLGLYRSSIIAAANLLRTLTTNVYDAPVFLGRLAYPVYYGDRVQSLAGQYGYDPRLQLALIRQESLFESIARSSAAAQGLSQVIPDTGAWIAQRLQWPDYENADLFKPYVGLIFGAYYLSQQLEFFDNQVHAALAAYNAGPGNAVRWYDLAGSNLDAFVDAVDFAETRLYVQRIYEGFSAYEHLYGDTR